MTLEELRLSRLVQGCLVRNYVDTQKLNVDVIGSSVYIEGEFSVYEYHPSQKLQDRLERELGVRHTLLLIERQIRAMGEISHLEFKFSNWERLSTGWAPRHHRA